MSIKKIEFLTSKPDVASCPETTLPEYAFIGRSNVGKSSLINMLANKKKLAKTSSTPGKTRLINYFVVDKAWHLVDLPGYGYAKLSKTAREQLRNLINGYVLKRSQLVCLFVLIDVRHEPLKADLEFMEWLGENQVPFAIIFTKSDKLHIKKVDENVEIYLGKMKEVWTNLPPYFISSSSTGLGKEKIINYIEEVNNKI